MTTPAQPPKRGRATTGPKPSGATPAKKAPPAKTQPAQPTSPAPQRPGKVQRVFAQAKETSPGTSASGVFGNSKILPVMFVVVLFIVTYDEIVHQKRFPQPRRYVGAGIVYGILGVLGVFSLPLASVLGTGFALSIVYGILANGASNAASSDTSGQGNHPVTPTSSSGGTAPGQVTKL